MDDEDELVGDLVELAGVTRTKAYDACFVAVGG
jgi:hypothetical protein